MTKSRLRVLVSLTVLIWKENLASKCEKTIPKILKWSLKFEKMFKLTNNIKNTNLIHTTIPAWQSL